MTRAERVKLVDRLTRELHRARQAGEATGDLERALRQRRAELWAATSTAHGPSPMLASSGESSPAEPLALDTQRAYCEGMSRDKGEQTNVVKRGPSESDYYPDDTLDWQER